MFKGAGAWLLAARAEQRRRFKAVICAKPRDFDLIRQERRRAEKEGTAIVPPIVDDSEEDDTKPLDGFFLVDFCFFFFFYVLFTYINSNVFVTDEALLR